jgi:hypothetical protein
MKRAVLVTFGWVIGTLGLYAALVMLELYWNFYDWQPRVDFKAFGLIFGMLAILAAIHYLARASCDRLSQGVSLMACLALLALAVYVFPPEPLTGGLFARAAVSPFWYRGARFVLLGLPGLFWVLAWLHR